MPARAGLAAAGVAFEDRGERELKGVGEPVRLFAVKELEVPNDGC